MEIIEIKTLLSNGFLVGDFVSFNQFVVVSNSGQIINPNQILKHGITWKFERPQVTILSPEEFLISEMDLSSFSKERNNAWIINNNGIIKNEFQIGQANKLVSTDKYIIATYSPSSFYAGKSLEFEIGGLAIFNHDGDCEYYLEPDLCKQLNLFQIYSISNFDNDYVYFQGYPNYDILKLDLNDFSITIEHEFSKDKLNINENFWIPYALSKKEDNWYFLTPNRETLDSTIFEMDKDYQIKEVGKCNYTYSPKGLSDGRFFVPSYNYDQRAILNCQLIECKNSI